MRFLRQIMLVAKRDTMGLLTTPLFFILSGIFFLLTSMIFLLTLMDFARGSEGMTVNVTDSVVRPTFHIVHFFLLVQIPLMTMRIFAEDAQSGMLDLLQTTPLGDWSMLLGKWTATFGAMAAYVLLTATFPLAVAWLGDVEWPVAVGSIAALLFCTAAYVSVGLFFSANTESQVVAAVLTYVTLFLLVFASALAGSSNTLFIIEAMRHLAVTEHVNALLAGNIAIMNASYFVLLTIAFLFLTARSLEARRRNR